MVPALEDVVAGGDGGEVVAAVRAGVADFAVDFFVVLRAVGAALVADALVARFRVEGVAFLADGFRAVVAAVLEADAAAFFAAEFAVDFRAGFGVDLDGVLEVVLRAGDF